MTNAVEGRVTELVLPLAAERDVEVFDVEYAGGVVRVFLDCEGGVDIDVLSNDDDPEVAGGPGDPDEVRIEDWQPGSVQGGTVSCGTPAQKGTATFASSAGLRARG